MDNLLSDEDLAGLLDGLEMDDYVPEEESKEIEASQRRYMEIIKKHKSDKSKE